MEIKGFKSSSERGHIATSPACAAFSCPARACAQTERALLRSIFSSPFCAHVLSFFGEKWRELLRGWWQRGGSINEERKPIFIYDLIFILELILLLGYYRLQHPAVAVHAIRVLTGPDWLKKNFYQNHPHRKLNFIWNEHFPRRHLLPSKKNQLLCWKATFKALNKVFRLSVWAFPLPS